MGVPRGKADSTPTGTLLNDVALNGAAATRQFIQAVGGFNNLLLFLNYTHANNGTLTVLLEGSDDAAGTNIFTLTTGSTSAGATTLNLNTGATTPTLSGDSKLSLLLDVKGYAFVRVTVTHNGSPDANDKLTVTGQLTA